MLVSNLSPIASKLGPQPVLPLSQFLVFHWLKYEITWKTVNDIDDLLHLSVEFQLVWFKEGAPFLPLGCANFFFYSLLCGFGCLYEIVDTIKKDYRRGRGSHKTSYLLFYELNLERGGGLSCPQYLMLVNNWGGDKQNGPPKMNFRYWGKTVLFGSKIAKAIN